MVDTIRGYGSNVIGLPTIIKKCLQESVKTSSIWGVKLELGHMKEYEVCLVVEADKGNVPI